MTEPLIDTTGIRRKQREWDEQYSMLFMSESAARQRNIFLEYNEQNYPHHAYLICNNDPAKMQITFIDSKDQPFFYSKEGALKSLWYPIDPLRAFLVNAYMVEMCPSQIERDGISVYLIPLYESELLDTGCDISAFLRNLSFWESLVLGGLPTPMRLRHDWIASKNKEYKEHVAKVNQAIGKIDAPLQEGATTLSIVRNLFSDSMRQREQGLECLYKQVMMEAERTLPDKDEQRLMRREMDLKKLYNLSENYQMMQRRIRMVTREIDAAQETLDNENRRREDYQKALLEMEKEMQDLKKQIEENEVL